ncbi:putative DNA binding domain-containing protein [bacterium]|nr:putative DNA binding domain-containing protein [bacterium]MBU1063870.1 putative DNA binding domain-containing protein [bacterium]MBU1633178.1 putative DNA binding domain-containing protein [bacterium]MBU1873887.1 putative DNA binding domain-containing protein [bacterium]
MTNQESQTVEYKQNWHNEYLKVVSAFANSRGGVLYIGLDDHGKSSGLKNVKKLLEDIPNTIRNKLGIIPSVELNRKSSQDIIKITVVPSSVPISCNGKYYLRSGSTVQELQGKELADFLIRKTGIAWDDAFEDRGNWDFLEESTIEDFKRFAVDRIPSIVREKDFVTILKKLNLIENQHLKRAAIMLFGKEVERFYSHACVKIGRFLSDTDIQITDIVKGNLFQQLETTLEILRSKYLQSKIKFEGIHRRDVLEYPYEALREAIINALIHRDYRSFSQIQIRVYPDKLIIMNAGSLPPEVPVESLKTEHLSRPRNKLLAETFYYAGFIEAWGRGTLKIVEKCVEQGLPEPDFKEENGVMTVVFYKNIFNEAYLSKKGLNERQMKAVLYVKEKGKITNTEYQILCKLKKRQTTDDLKDLENKNIFMRIGSTGKGTHYILKGR